MHSILKVLDTPMVSHWLCNLRNKNSSNVLFRQAVELLSQAVFLEAASNFDLKKSSFETPVGPANGYLVNQDFAIVPILRAGIGMVDPILRWLGDARVYHLGASRNHDTLEPEFYYDKLPKDISLMLHYQLPNPKTETVLKHSTPELVQTVSSQSRNMPTYLPSLGTSLRLSRSLKPSIKPWASTLTGRSSSTTQEQ